jgi:hypothetical protein
VSLPQQEWQVINIKIEVFWDVASVVTNTERLWQLYLQGQALPEERAHSAWTA